MSAFDALLRLQDHDVHLDQLRYKVAHLPEWKAVDANAAARDALEAEAGPVQARRDELAREQKRIEDEVATVEAKVAAVGHKLYDSGITSPKELQALQADLDSLKRRQTQLEDGVLELMEQVEPLDGELSAIDTRRRSLAVEGEEAQAALDAASGAAGHDLAAAEGERAGVSAEVPPHQLAAYDQARMQFGTVAVARLVGTQCQGCHLTLSAVALQAARKLPPDAVLHCEECGRMLVR